MPMLLQAWPLWRQQMAALATTHVKIYLIWSSSFLAQLSYMEVTQDNVIFDKSASPTYECHILHFSRQNMCVSFINTALGVTPGFPQDPVCSNLLPSASSYFSGTTSLVRETCGQPRLQGQRWERPLRPLTPLLLTLGLRWWLSMVRLQGNKFVWNLENKFNIN